MPFRDIQNLAFGFRRLSKIDGLSGLSNLTKLQLDNNNLTKIENLGLLVKEFRRAMHMCDSKVLHCY